MPLKVVIWVMLSSIGRRSLLHRIPLSQNAKEPATIDRITNPQRHPLRPEMKSFHSTSLNENHKSAAATAAERTYLIDLFNVSFIIEDKVIQKFTNFVELFFKN